MTRFLTLTVLSFSLILGTCGNASAFAQTNPAPGAAITDQVLWSD